MEENESFDKILALTFTCTCIHVCMLIIFQKRIQSESKLKKDMKVRR